METPLLVLAHDMLKFSCCGQWPISGPVSHFLASFPKVCLIFVSVKISRKVVVNKS